MSYGSTSYELEKPPSSREGGEVIEPVVSPTAHHSETQAQDRHDVGTMGRMRGLLSGFGLGGPPPPPAPPGGPGPTPGAWTNTQNAFLPIPKTVEERLKPTLDLARADLVLYTQRANISSLALNGAIGAQVLLGALITGISAAASPRGAQVSTSILGGLSTLMASYLARARGSGEPEQSRERMRDLQKFVRNCESTILDWGYERPNPHNLTPKHVELLKQIDDHRTEYDNLISAWNGEKVTSA